MERFVKMDFKRFVSIHKFWMISLVLGVIITTSHFVEGVLYSEYDAYGIPGNAYISWIGGSFFYSQSYWFYFVLPLLVSVSVGLDYGILKKRNYFFQYKVRMTKKRYMLLQGAKVFSLGFLVITIPLAWNFVLTMMERPLLYPDPLVAIGPLSDEIGATLYYSHPMIYTMLYICFDGIFAGAVAFITVALCAIIENYFLATMLPFVICYILYTIGGLFEDSYFTLNRLLMPVYGTKSVIEYLVAASVVVFSMVAWIGLGLKEEL